MKKVQNMDFGIKGGGTMTKEEYITRFKSMDDHLNELWEKNQFKDHYLLLQEEHKLLDQMDLDPNLTREDKLYITSTMIKYGRKK